MRLVASLLVLALFVPSCRTPDPNRVRQRVAVAEFIVDDDATLRQFDLVKLRAETAPLLTKRTVDHLKARDFDAVPVPVGVTAPEADLFVTGRIVQADGGSSSARTWRTVLMIFCWPCAIGIRSGFAHLGVAGEVRRADGTVVGQFDFEKVGKGMESAAIRSGVRVADMISENAYEQSLARQAPVRPSVAQPVRSRGTADRLGELDSLRARGLVSDEEYQRKRAQILGEL